LSLPPPVANATADECLQAYLRALEREQYQEWQVEQARQSVTAWFAWRGGQAKTQCVSKLKLSADRTVERKGVVRREELGVGERGNVQSRTLLR
jgi:hypothetical protein